MAIKILHYVQNDIIEDTDKLEFVDVFSTLKQAKDKRPSLKGKVPDRADGWSVSDQKVL